MMPKPKGQALQIPNRERARWLKTTFRFTDTEMAYLLNISIETLRLWLKDPQDKRVVESARFQRLVNIVQLAEGVIRSKELGNWLHAENKALGELVPAHLLANPAGFRLVSTLLEDIRTGA